MAETHCLCRGPNCTCWLAEVSREEVPLLESPQIHGFSLQIQKRRIHGLSLQIQKGRFATPSPSKKKENLTPHIFFLCFGTSALLASQVVGPPHDPKVLGSPSHALLGRPGELAKLAKNPVKPLPRRRRRRRTRRYSPPPTKKAYF